MGGVFNVSMPASGNSCLLVTHQLAGHYGDHSTPNAGDSKILSGRGKASFNLYVEMPSTHLGAFNPCSEFGGNIASRCEAYRYGAGSSHGQLDGSVPVSQWLPWSRRGFDLILIVLLFVWALQILIVCCWILPKNTHWCLLLLLLRLQPTVGYNRLWSSTHVPPPMETTNCEAMVSPKDVHSISIDMY